MRNTLTNQRGLTLIELLASLAIFAVIGAIMFSLILSAMNNFGSGMAQSQLVKESELIELKLKQVVRNATHFGQVQVESPENSGTYINLTPPQYQFFSSSGDKEDIFFVWDSPNLTVKQGSSIMVLSNKVTAFSLVNEDRKILFSIKLDDGNQSIEVSGTGAVFMPSWN
jgi:prepilin-type N-terminal cleavage/methylation domain-containing protein